MVKRLPARMVDATGATNGHVLTVVGGVAAWAVGGSGGGGGATNLDGLSDVVVASPVTGQTIRWNGTTFVNSALAIADITGLSSSLSGLSTSKANVSHTHAAADVTSGVFNTARLGTGTADATTVLYGDGTWKTAPTGGGLTAEDVRDTIGAALAAGSGITVTVNDAGDTITIASTVAPGLSLEQVQDAVAAMMTAGTGITYSYDDAAGTLTTTASGGGGTTDPEVVRDTMAAALVAGTGITLTVDDAGDTITITSTGGGGGATTLDALTDVDTTTAPPTDRQALVWDDALGQWVAGDVAGGGGGATTLDSLTDVASPDPGDGYVLMYNATTDQWEPRPGGGAVGSWVLQKIVTFTAPAWVENDLQAAPLAVGASKPPTPQIAFTVTQDMLCTSSDAADANAIGWQNHMLLTVSVKHQANTGTAMTLNYEMTRNGAVVVGTSDTGHANTERGTLLNVVRGAAVGDEIKIFVWLTGTSNNLSVIDWWGRGCVPGRLFKNAPPGGGRYAYKRLDVLTTSPAQNPATVLSWLPAWSGQSNAANMRYYSNGVDQQTAISASMLAISNEVEGIVQHYGTDYALGSTLIDQTATNVFSGGAPLSVRFDQLAIPWAS